MDPFWFGLLGVTVFCILVFCFGLAVAAGPTGRPGSAAMKRTRKKKTDRQAPSLKQLVAHINPENRPGEVPIGAEVGREAVQWFDCRKRQRRFRCALRAWPVQVPVSYLRRLAEP